MMKKTIQFVPIIAIAMAGTMSSCVDSGKDLYDRLNGILFFAMLFAPFLLLCRIQAKFLSLVHNLCIDRIKCDIQSIDWIHII